MIVSEQERAAKLESIMRTVVEYANTHSKAERYKREGHEDAGRWADSAGLVRLEVKNAIRAMLAPDDAVIRERIAEAVIDGVNWSGGHDWADPARIPEGDDPEDWSGDYVRWDLCNDEWRDHGYRTAEAVLAVLRGEATRDE